MLFKIDLKRAFRNLKVDPGDVHNLCLQFDNKYYIDLSIPFGYKHGSFCCQRMTDAVREICRRQCYWLWNYIDDLIGVECKDKIESAFNFLKTLLKELGLPINNSKTIEPCHVVTCIGISVNANDFTLSIDQLKLKEIFHTCEIAMRYSTIN